MRLVAAIGSYTKVYGDYADVSDGGTNVFWFPSEGDVKIRWQSRALLLMRVMLIDVVTVTGFRQEKAYGP